MSLEDYWFERAVEIRVLAPDGTLVRRGSGFMVAPGVILTALHVAVGAAAVPNGPVRCSVRLLADIRAVIDADGDPEDTPFQPAELKWPAPGAAPGAGDAALLVVAAKDRTRTMADCAALPVLKSDFGRSVAGVGMPALAKIIDPSRRNMGFRDIKGSTSNRFVADALVELTLDDQKHPDPDEWKGASGAVLLDAKGGVLVGILVEADHTGYAKLKSDPSRPVMIEMLADFAETPGFRKVVELEVVPDELAPTTEVPANIIGAARKLLHKFDRTPQITQVEKLFKSATTGKYKPVILVARMKEQDCPDLFIETLSEKLMATFKDRRNCYGKPSDLNWRVGLSSQRALAILKSDIVGDVVAADEAGLDEAHVAGQTKRLFAVSIRSEADEPTRDELKDLLTWWFKRPECDGGPATLLVKIVDTLGSAEQCEKAANIYRNADALFVGPPALADPNHLLEPLARCIMKDVLDWSELALKTSVDRYRDRIVKRLNTSITTYDKGANPFPLSVVRSALL